MARRGMIMSMKKFTAILILTAMCLSSFTAFAEWTNEEDIMTLLSELEIMQGDPDGNYRLDNFVSRAECTKMAVMASAYKNSVAAGIKTSPFYDVPASHWASAYIQIAVSKGLCKGYIDSTFRPDGTVLFEEAITIYLKILGYTDDDFGSSWPYGQVGIAKQIELTKGISKGIGEYLDRRDMMYLTYNLLNTNPKGGNSDYINTLDYSIIDDVILVSSPLDDSSVGSGKIFTTSGTFKVKDDFNYSNVGKKGSLIVKNTDEAVSFIPSEQIIEKYNIYQILNGDVIVMENSAMTTVDLDDTLTVYNKTQKTSFGALAASVNVGDTLTVYSNSAGIKDYGVIKTEELKGPYTYKSASQITAWGLKNPTVTRNGSIAALSDLKANDIVYYSANIDGIWAYSKTATGIYEKALPNKDNPTSVVISNVTYKLESTQAWQKLSSGGNIEYGDRITVLLGKNNDIADVLTGEPDTAEVVGYFIESGKQQYTRDDNSVYVSNYAKLALPNGDISEYSVNADYDTFLNSVVKINFSGGTGKIARQTAKSGISGTVSYENRKIGNTPFASSVDIIDISTTEPSKSGSYTKVFLQRLDGVNLSESDILYCSKNSAGEIKEMILKDVTGDMYSYGVVTSAKEASGGLYLSGSYTIDIGGNVTAMQTNSVVYNVISGQPARISTDSRGMLQSLSALTRLDAVVSKVTIDSVTAGSKKYKLYDKATVYKKDAMGNYTIIPLSDIVNGSQKYQLTAYYDKTEKTGGLIRIIVAR